jgi:hypothetical protein
MKPDKVVDGIDFELISGGTISGRVLGQDGLPVSAQEVSVKFVSDDGTEKTPPYCELTRLHTDSEGAYAARGLPAGRYRVSVTTQPTGRGGQHYPNTYYPGVTDAVAATLVTIQGGSEASNVNIPLGPPIGTHKATGHVIDGQDSKPLPGIFFGVSFNSADDRFKTYGMSFRADPNGDFNVPDLMPGHYTIYAIPDPDHLYYGDPMSFDIDGEDMSGLEVRLRPTLTMRGKVRLVGTWGPEFLAKVPEIHLFAHSHREQGALVMGSNADVVTVDANGNFQISGVLPGRVFIGLDATHSPKGISLIRMEKDGAPVKPNPTPNVVSVEDGEVTGLEAVLAYGSVTLSGRVKTLGGSLPQAAEVQVVAIPLSPDLPWAQGNTHADLEGRFTVEGLGNGDYELWLICHVSGPKNHNVTQTVTIANGKAPFTVIPLDMNSN